MLLSTEDKLHVLSRQMVVLQLEFDVSYEASWITPGRVQDTFIKIKDEAELSGRRLTSLQVINVEMTFRL